MAPFVDPLDMYAQDAIYYIVEFDRCVAMFQQEQVLYRTARGQMINEQRRVHLNFIEKLAIKYSRKAGHEALARMAKRQEVGPG